ncbi:MULTISPECIES: Rne/Rng family ribonuclease [Agrobacterium tumefaciens complex]|jgi:ribonuclease E|uniref:Ribonuclease E n=3 Tax=Agrobacterium tumefaciens complex TaxID=1183400 RepID=A0AAW8LSC2_AGRTU|nr:MULTISPECIES: ribonuclease E/G [Agrobacterium tumefaciens complex]MCP2134958.1 ribonuclease E [Rhizobium sp. SLBN-94]TGE82590.1 ribonuclease E/G [Rhizobium sp. SEMIA 439]AYM80876.1 ribonuclease E [Agrobacterium tumefaciens]KAA1236736.1 ribonuclease E/G [Agrobacterium tumefaciens]KAB0462584.1 ribonuclease E/G [Agrobacterium tumefaciens]
MADKMLIDASHEEETRVVVVRGNRIEEFDFESEHKKQIRGNIYLAKVTRVEPSLQAAFVDYGGNRHGFLAFAEIHPDYYQIPLADRQALLKAEAEDHRRSDDFESADAPEPGAPMIDLSQVDQPDVGIVSASETTETVVVEETAPVAEEVSEETAVEAVAVEAPAEEEKPKKRTRRPRAKKKTAEEEAAAAAEASSEDDGSTGGEMAAMVDTDTISEEVEGLRRGNDDDDDDDDDHHEKEVIESVGAEDAMEEVPDRVARKPRKQYRIQEVIKRRQILLVQVAKEERGNKGAALTTYLSLAGRYSVLMPNTARGGGISRKITQPTDRKRLKEIARDLEVPQGMGVILRTAGANRTRVEIKRDFEYLMRLWENVRTLTLNSTAPCLVYEEGSLIKRSIRDLYNKDIGEIIVSGEEGYREAKDFMKMLMPSHAKVVQPYRDIHPIFSRSGIEAQLDRMLQPQVTLKSGGYLIINQTEALVSIDVNSGRSTREHSIEETALTTNLEAAEEVARQLRLRDLAGLVVIDFIDMEEKRNNRSVEKKLKDCLKNDRARIQVGRISHFGLLEMSRQRIRASVLESTTQVCQHCGGTGHVRSESSIALHVLRGVEEYLLRNTTHNITVRCTPETALYLLNHKRGTIVDYEGRFGVSIIIAADAGVGAQHFAIDRGEAVENPVKIESLIQMLPSFVEEEDDFVAEVEEDEDEEEIVKAQTSEPRQQQPQGDNSEEGKRKRKRRRRRRGKGGQGDQNGALDAQSGDAEGDDAEGDDDGIETDEADAENENGAAEAVGSEEDGKRKRRRRGKRGGRRNRAEDEALDAAGSEAEGESESEEVSVEASVTEEPTAAAAVEGVVAEVAEEEVPKKPRRTRKAKVKTETEEAPKAEAVETVEPVIVEETVAEVAVEEAGEASADLAPEAEAPATEEKVRANRGSNVSSSEPVVTSSSPNPDGDEPKPRKGGWWQRKGFF